MARRSEDGRWFLSSGALVLNCPGCGSQVAANTSICSVCDFIIDGSFLSGEPPADSPEESTDAAEDPRRAAKPPPARRPRPSSGRSGSRPAAAPPSADATNIRSMDEVVRNAPQQRAARPAPSRPAPRRAAAPEPAAADPWDRADSSESSGAVADPDELLRDAKELFGMLHGGDKVAFWGSALVLMSCFLPWKETAVDGDVLGLMSQGAGAFVLSILLLTAVTVRVKGSFPNVNPVVPWMGQLITSIVCLIWCVVYIKMASDTTMVPTPIGNSEMMNSSPSFGVYVAVLGSIAALGGTLLGLKGQSEH